MKKILFVASMLFAVSASAQADKSAKYANVIKADYLKKHLTVIAGEDMQGRETGSEGERKAAAYIITQFKSMGLTTAPGLNGSYQQFFPLHKDSLHESELEIDGKSANYGADYLSPASANETGKFKGKSIVFAGYGIEDKAYNDYASLDVKDKVVVIMMGEPKADGKFLISGGTRGSDWSMGFNKKLALAASKGAAGVLLVSPSQVTFNQRAIDNSKKTNLYYPRVTEEKRSNFALLSHAYASAIFGSSFDSTIRKAGRGESFTAADMFEKDVKADLKIKKEREIINSSNVIGVIEGTDKKDEYVFLTAHYDHLGMRDGKIFYGADDDGSGTVGIMNMAAAFAKAKKDGNGPRRTIVVMAVSGEEKGLWGSEYYSENPLFPMEKTTVDLNIDMVGRIDTERKSADTMNYIYVIGHDKLSSDLPVINEGANKKHTKLVFDYKFDDPKDPNRIYFRSDHYNFARKGVPVLFFYDGMLQADYHKSSDTVDKITWPLYEKRVRMIFHTAWEMANRNEMLKRDIPLNVGTR